MSQPETIEASQTPSNPYAVVRSQNAVVRPLPCPFCGSESIAVVEGTSYRWVTAQCSDCGAQCGEIRRRNGYQPTAETKAQDDAEAIAEWNIRSNPTGQTRRDD
jgi:Lar family restriction alleviation protein